MAREAYTDKAFVEFSRRIVLMRVLVDQDPQGERLANRYQAEGLPTLVVFDSQGREVDRLIGARTARELIEELEVILAIASGNNPFPL